MPDTLVPAATAVYRAWAADVKARGGVVTALPHVGTPAAKYAFAIWSPRVKSGAWAAPTVLSRNGEYAYYAADRAVERAAAELPKASAEEIALGAARLKDSWLDVLREMGTRAFWLALFVIVLAVMFLVWRTLRLARSAA